MAYVLAILNQKGGAGKSTLATNLARAYQLRGLRVLVADADPQATARNWRERGPEGLPPVVGADHDRMDEDLEGVKPAFDLIVIDGAPRMEGRAVAAIKAADGVAIPVRPSAGDLWAMDTLVELVQTRREITGGPDAAFVVSQAVTGSNLASEADDALAGRPFPTLRARTGQRVAYAEAMGAGLSVLDYEPSGKAAAEIEAIADELSQLFDVEERA